MMHMWFRGRRPSPLIVVAVVLGLLGGVLMSVFARRVDAQQSPVSFVYLRGADTLAVETVTPGNGVVKGVLSNRGQPRIEWTQERSPAKLTMNVFAATADASAAPLQVAIFTPNGDSIFAEIGTPGAMRSQMFASRAGALPLINASVLHSVLLSQMARSQSLTTLPVFLTSGARTLDATIAFRGDTASTFTLAGQPMTVVWEGGIPREMTLAAQNLRVVRVAGSVKVPAALKIDYSAPAGAPYAAENVVIPTARGYTLAGTITKPNGVAKMPVVVTVSGSGPQERDERLESVLPGYALFREIADTLGRRGVAVLRYDDRGVGESGGVESRGRSTSVDFAEDVQSVIAYLRTRPDVDASRIVVLGHSEGGLIGPIVAAREPSLRALVMMAGPAYDGRRVLDFQIGNQFKALVKAKSKADPGIAEAMSKGENMDAYVRTRTTQMIDSMRNDPWTKYFIDTDPKVTLRQVRQPVLVLQGGTDMQVTPEQADTVVAVLKAAGNTRVTAKTFRETNHLFVPDPSGVPTTYSKLKDYHVRREVLGTLADWIVQTVR